MNLLLRVSNYITRYAPSEKKLRAYISKKNPTLDISLFLSEIGYSESMMCDMWIRTFLSSSRGEREMREKLYKKGFPKEIIEEKIYTAFSDIQNWEVHKGPIESLMDHLLKKGKSKKIIEITLLGKYPYFRGEIETLLEEKSEESGLREAIGKYKAKYDISDFSERQKFFAAMGRKGFEYRKTRDYLESIGSSL